MKEALLERLKTVTDVETKSNVLREYLQCIILKFVEEKGYIKNISFVGGTALRFLYDLNRFSEDLDFSLVRPEGFSFEHFSDDLMKAAAAWNIKTESKAREVMTVKSILIKFPGIMHEVGLTHRQDQKLLIKLEIDGNPPLGFKTELSFNQKYLPLNIFHHDIPSLFAGKLHAVLLRQYTKGRDFYDLMWFLGKKTEPNFPQLSNAMEQTTGQKISLNKELLRKMLLKRIEEVDFKKVNDELVRFLLNKDETKYINLETFKQLINAASF